MLMRLAGINMFDVRFRGSEHVFRADGGCLERRGLRKWRGKLLAWSLVRNAY